MTLERPSAAGRAAAHGADAADGDPRAWRRGLIVGRFCPPHLGHSFMIDTAASQVDELVVMVNTRDGESVPGELRAEWLAHLHPAVTVVEVRHDLGTDFGDEDLWRQWMALFRSRWPLAGDGPDVVFSSEVYGNEIAKRFGADAVVVDPDRTAVPISATLIRERPLEHLHFLAPPVRVWVEEQARRGVQLA